MNEPKRIYVEVEGGCVTAICGDRLDTKEQIMFVVRDFDNIHAGDEDPAPEGYEPEVLYW